MATSRKTYAGKKSNTRTKGFFCNRKVKDRLFCFIFEQDRKALLQLYNALNGTDYQDAQTLQIVTLRDVVYMSMNNDVAFVLTETLNLYEHQSTICPNIPLRFLLYLAGEFEGIVSRRKESIYGRTLMKLPAPQCVVFYNGETQVPEEQFLYLTDAFMDADGNPLHSCIELTVRVLNINHGHNQELMQCCTRLHEYSLFVDQIRHFQKEGYSTDKSIDKAVAHCINHNIMKDILLPFRAEVKKMLLTEYDEKKTMWSLKREAQEEGRMMGLQEGRMAGLQEGRIAGLQEGRMAGLQEGRMTGLQEGRSKERGLIIRRMLQNGLSVEQISQITNLSLQEIEEAGQSTERRSSQKGKKKA